MRITSTRSQQTHLAVNTSYLNNLYNACWPVHGSRCQQYSGCQSNCSSHGSQDNKTFARALTSSRPVSWPRLSRSCVCRFVLLVQPSSQLFFFFSHLTGTLSSQSLLSLPSSYTACNNHHKHRCVCCTPCTACLSCWRLLPCRQEDRRTLSQLIGWKCHEGPPLPAVYWCRLCLAVKPRPQCALVTRRVFLGDERKARKIIRWVKHELVRRAIG